MIGKFFKFIFQDWNANAGNAKGRTFLVLFRMANICTVNRIYFYLGLPYLVIYKLFIQWVYTLELPWSVKVGPNLRIYHGQALIVNKYVIIGSSCTLRHCTTIGVKQNADGTNSAAPVIGNHVDIGNNVCIIGGITLANNVKIGSGSVVVKSVVANSVVAGNPATEIRKKAAVIRPDIKSDYLPVNNY